MAMTKFNELLQVLHRGVNPYTNFPAAQWAGRWYDDPGARRDILKRNLDKALPQQRPTGIVVEVGSFVGESAIYQAKHLKSKGADAVVLCIDTWYGGIDHYKGAPEKINHHFGRPDLFYRFMANVILHQCQDMILPVAIDSLNGARLLNLLNIQPAFVYVDASHEQGDAGRDYEAYWDVLPSGGVMMVDDISNHFPGCVHDWNEFTKKHKIPESKWDVAGEKIAVVKP